MNLTVPLDGWSTVRRAVFRRDGGCVAVQPKWFGDDVAPDICRDQTGVMIRWDHLFSMEADHVTDDGGIRRDDVAHLITVCPWHHRGSGWRIDTKEHRATARDVLRSLYPEVWS